jgi:hypothetical protein
LRGGFCTGEHVLCLLCWMRHVPGLNSSLQADGLSAAFIVRE